MTIGEWPQIGKSKNLNVTISRFSVSGGFLDDHFREAMVALDSIEPTISRIRFCEIAKTLGMVKIQSSYESFEIVRRQSETGATALAAKWKAMLLDRNAPVNAKALTATVKPIFQALSWFGAGAVDLSDLPVESVNGMHLAVILRATYSRKSQTFGWDRALDVAREALKRDGINEAHALAGLS
jgi:hypothetical protein